MKKIMINGYEFEFDNDLVEKLEALTCDKLDNLAKCYVELGFEEETLEEIFNVHPKEEIQQKILDSILAEIRLFA